MSQRFSTGWSWRFLAVTAVGALAFAGVAVAKHVSASTETVSATFTATTVSDRRTKECTGADGTYQVTHAKYTGTAVSADGRLDGPLELHVKSTYNTTEKVGWISVKAKVRGDDGHVDARGHLRAVNVDGKIEGLLVGDVRGPRGKLLGNVSATYSSEGGFTDGQLGTGSTANTAIVHTRGCVRAEPDKPAKAEKEEKQEHARAAKKHR